MEFSPYFAKLFLIEHYLSGFREERQMSFYQKNEEDEEDVGEKVDRPEEGVGLLDGLEVEVAQNHPEKRQDGRRECTEVVALWKIIE